MYALCLFFRAAMNKKHWDHCGILYSLEVQRGQNQVKFHLPLREVKQICPSGLTPHTTSFASPGASRGSRKRRQSQPIWWHESCPPHYASAFQASQFSMLNGWQSQAARFLNDVYNLYKSIQIISRLGKSKFWIFQHLQILHPQIYIHMKSKYPPKETESNNWNWNNWMFNQLNWYLQNLYPTICNSLPTSHLKKGVMDSIPGRPQRIIFGLRIRRTAQKVACGCRYPRGDPSRLKAAPI